jgi:hypothetical protein
MFRPQMRENAKKCQKSERILAKMTLLVVVFILKCTANASGDKLFGGFRLTKMMQRITVLIPASHTWGVYGLRRCFT